MLTLMLPRLIEVVSLSSNLKLEFGKFLSGYMNEEEILRSTEEMKTSLSRETQQLLELASMIHVDAEMDRNCKDICNRINQQAHRISHFLVSPVNKNEVSEGIELVNSNISLLEGRLSSHYDEIAGNEERQKLIAECYKKALKAIRRYPPPVFEENFEEYENAVEGIDVTYSDDGRSKLNKKTLQLPGMVSFIASLTKTEKRNRLLGLIREYDENDPTAMNPLPQDLMSLLPCTGVIDFLKFSTEEELKNTFVNFFKDGNWLEVYVFLMLDRAGCSTTLLNTRISKNTISLEIDVLALFRNKLFVFEAKDRSSSNGLTARDFADITEQIEKIASLESTSVEMVYVISLDDSHQATATSKIGEICTLKGITPRIIFLSNVGDVDDIVAKIRGVLR